MGGNSEASPLVSRPARAAAVFRFLYQPKRPKSARLVANSGNVDGIGVAAVIDPSVKIFKLPMVSG